MLLGYALPERDEKLFRDILPYDRMRGAEAVMMGNFLGFAEKLFATTEALGRNPYP